MQWISLATSAAVFGLLFAFFAWRGGDRAPIVAPIAAVAAPKPVVVVQNNNTPPPQPETPAASATQPIAEVPDPEPPKPEETVKITNDMIDKYLQEMPQQEVDLTGVTPIRWDEDELSGKANAQNQPRDEKIDPVKLDAALLKDLQTAKKTKEEGGGKEGGVDIAVMKEQGGNLKAKGDKGSDKGALADAVSKDPRGEASRMATRPPLKGFPIRSAARLPTKQKGEDRPMTVLDFLTAVERAKSAAAAVNTDATVAQAGPVEENPVPQEELTEEAGPLAETYFAQLRKADGLAGQASTGGGR